MEQQTPLAPKVLVRITPTLLAILDIAMKAKKMTRTKLINLAVKEWVQSHKEEIQQDIRTYEELLSTNQM